MNIDLLKELSEAHGVPGQEASIRKIVNREMKAISDISVDTMGNMTCLKKGSGKGPKLMIAAHMDEIGFVVKYIDDKGFLRVNPLGGWDPRTMMAQRVIVQSDDGPIPGLMMPGVKPKHMLTAADANKVLAHDDYFVDIGMSGKDAQAKINIGDMVTMDRQFQSMGDLLTGKAMDNRVAVFVMIEAMKKAKKHVCDVYGVATVQEEIGLRGASASGSAIQPDICVAIDITLANDIPGIPAEFAVTRLGEGTAIKVMDSSLICHPKLVAHFKQLAVQKKIKHQMELLPFGGTDAGAVQRLHGGIPSFTLSVPTRYVHTVNETLHKDDLKASVDLLAAYIEDAHKGDYSHEIE